MTTHTYSTNADDSWCDGGSTFNSTGTTLYVAGDSGGAAGADVRTYIPFVVNIPQGKQIVSATLRWVATDTRTEDFDIGLHCEAADNSTAPTTAAQLQAKSVTTGYTVAVPDYTTGVEYSNTVTTAVQAVLDRAGWVSGNTLAIIVDDGGATAGERREIASYENGSYTEPQLDIVINYIPLSGGLI